MIKVLIGNGTFSDKTEYFQSISIKKSMTSLCSLFNLQTFDLNKQTNIEGNNNCNIYLLDKNGYNSIVNGYVDTIDVTTTTKSSNLKYSGRDKCSFIVDCDIISSNTYPVGSNLVNIIKTILINNTLDFIEVNNNTGRDLILNADFRYEIGNNLWETIKGLCYSHSVICRADYYGNITLENSGRFSNSSILVKNNSNDNNTSNSSLIINGSKLYGQYIVFNMNNSNNNDIKENSTKSEDFFSKNSNSLNKYIFPFKNVTEKRIKVLMANKDAGEDYARRLAQWVNGEALAESFRYTVILPGFTDANGELWKINSLVNVVDNSCDINDQLLILETIFSWDEVGGYKTELVCIKKDAFNFFVKPKKGKDNRGEGIFPVGIFPVMKYYAGVGPYVPNAEEKKEEELNTNGVNIKGQ